MFPWERATTTRPHRFKVHGCQKWTELRLWLVWNQDLTSSPRLIATDHPTKWRAPGFRLGPHTFVKTREDTKENLFSKCVRYAVFRGHFTNCTGRVTSLEPKESTPTILTGWKAPQQSGVKFARTTGPSVDAVVHQSTGRPAILQQINLCATSFDSICVAWS